MSLAATRKEVHDAIVTKIKTATDIGPVYNRIRRPKQNTEGQIQSLFNDPDGILNVVFVRYVAKVIEASSFDDTISVNYVFEIELRYAWNDRDDSDSPTEDAFNALLDAIEAVFEADKNIGFEDVGVSTKGFEILRPIERDPQDFYAMLCHTAYGRVVANVADC
jgi:hypothetical protein